MKLDNQTKQLIDDYFNNKTPEELYDIAVKYKTIETDEALNMRIVGKSFFKRCKITFQKFYWNMFIKDVRYELRNKPKALKLANRYHRYKMYLLNK